MMRIQVAFVDEEDTARQYLQQALDDRVFEVYYIPKFGYLSDVVDHYHQQKKTPDIILCSVEPTDSLSLTPSIKILARTISYMRREFPRATIILWSKLAREKRCRKTAIKNGADIIISRYIQKPEEFAAKLKKICQNRRSRSQ